MANLLIISSYIDICRFFPNHPKITRNQFKTITNQPQMVSNQPSHIAIYQESSTNHLSVNLGIVASFNVSSWHQNYQIWPLVSLCPSILGQPISPKFDRWHCRIPQCPITISVNQHNNISYVYWCYYYQHHQTISIMWHFWYLWNVAVSLTPVMCPWHGVDQFYFINIIMMSVSSLSLHRSIHLLYHIGWLIMLFN